MKIGIIIETKEPEKAWNAFRFAVTAQKQGHEVIEGEILACGTCLKSRQLVGTEACPVSTMVDCVNMVVWAERVMTF